MNDNVIIRIMNIGSLFVVSVFLIALIPMFGFSFWRINIDGEEIVYRNAIGITKKYTFNDITEIR